MNNIGDMPMLEKKYEKYEKTTSGHFNRHPVFKL